MIAEILKELSAFFETRVQPGELGRRELRVSGWISGIEHGVDGIGRRRQNPRI
jgi:hypothetical protein